MSDGDKIDTYWHELGHVDEVVNRGKSAKDTARHSSRDWWGAI